MQSLSRRTFVLFHFLALLGIFVRLPAAQAVSAAPVAQPGNLPACTQSTPVPVSGVTCKNLQIVFLIDDSGSMGFAGDGSDPEGRRFAVLADTVDRLAGVYLAQLEAGAVDLPKIRVAAVHFASSVISSSGWAPLEPPNRAAWNGAGGPGAYQSGIMDRLTGSQVRSLVYNTAPDRRTNFIPPFQEAARLLNQDIPQEEAGCQTRLVFLLTDAVPDEGQGELTRLKYAAGAASPLAAYFEKLRAQVEQIEGPLSLYVLVFPRSDLTSWKTIGRFWQENLGLQVEAFEVNPGGSVATAGRPDLLDFVHSKVIHGLLPASPGPVEAAVSAPDGLAALKVAYSAPFPEARLEILDPQGRLLAPAAGKVTLSGEGTAGQEWTIQAPAAGDYRFHPYVLDPLRPGKKQPLPGGSLHVVFDYPPQETGLKLAVSSTPLQQFTRGDVSFRLLDASGGPLMDGSSQPFQYLVSYSLPGGETGTQELTPANGTFTLKDVLALSSGPGSLDVRVLAQEPGGNACVLQRVQAGAAFQVTPVHIVAAEPDPAACPSVEMPVRIPLALVDSAGHPTSISLPIVWQVHPAQAGGSADTAVRPDGEIGHYVLSLASPAGSAARADVTAVVEHDGQSYPLYSGSFEPNRPARYAFQLQPEVMTTGSRLTWFSRLFRQTSIDPSGTLRLARQFWRWGPAEIRITGRLIDRDTGKPVAGIDRFQLELAPDAPGATQAPVHGWQPGGDGTFFVTFAEPPLGRYHLVVTGAGKAQACPLTVSSLSLNIVRSGWEYLLVLLSFLLLMLVFFFIWLWYRRRDRGVLVPVHPLPDEPEKKDDRDRPEDDLKIIEGIGPKVEALLHANGITTFEQLALSSPRLAEIQAWLDAAGYEYMDPGTWPEQARLLAVKDWTGFKKLSDELVDGRPRKSDGDLPPA